MLSLPGHDTGRLLLVSWICQLVSWIIPQETLDLQRTALSAQTSQFLKQTTMTLRTPWPCLGPHTQKHHAVCSHELATLSADF